LEKVPPDALKMACSGFTISRWFFTCFSGKRLELLFFLVEMVSGTSFLDAGGRRTPAFEFGFSYTPRAICINYGKFRLYEKVVAD